MRQTLPEGQALSYAPYITTEVVEEYNGEPILRSVDILAGGCSYTPSPASQSTDPSESILTPNSELPSFSPGIDCSQYSCPSQQNSLPATPSVTATFPTPPPSVSYTLEQGTSIPPASAYNSLRSGAPSPTTWHSSGFGQLHRSQFVWDAPDDLQNRNTGVFVSPYEGHFPPQLPSSTYCTPSPTIQSQMQPEALMDHNDTAMDPYSAEAGKIVAPTVVCRHSGNENPDLFRLNDEETYRSPTPVNVAKRNRVKKAAGKPYAQLIWEAFMSTPTYSMLLRKLYQWFRDNTDKASTESKGWQNSIRHNLSMNDAFIRREGKSSDKKPSEWMLADWAIREGVQSTTRYRKGNSGRRSGAAGQNRSRRAVSGRASSARKSGINPFQNKSVETRASTLGQPVGHHLDPFHNATYNRPASYTYPHDAVKAPPLPKTSDWVPSQSHTTTPLCNPEYELATYACNDLPQNQVIDGLGQRRQAQDLYSPVDFSAYGISAHAQAHNSHVTPGPSYEDFVSTSQAANNNSAYFAWDTTPSDTYT